MPRRRGRGVGAAVLVIVGLIAAFVIAAVVIIRLTPHRPGLPGAQRCVATASSYSVAEGTEELSNAAIIAAVSVRRGLAPRAASIALTTAIQESKLINLDHGDRDSVGLFQQRPSMGWGSKKKLMDPVYATNKFYDALIKIDGWEHDDITEIAQRIQISGYPEAYREHEQEGRTLASVLTGQSPAGLRCLIHDHDAGDGVGLARLLHKAYNIKPKRVGKVITISAKSKTAAWSYAQFALAQAGDRGVRSVQIGAQQFTVSSTQLASWRTAAKPISGHAVRITVR